MRISNWAGLLLAAPLVYGRGYEPGWTSLSPRSSSITSRTPKDDINPVSQKEFQKIMTMIPSCAVECLVTLVKDTACKFGDLECMCRDSKYEDLATMCVKKACMMSEALATKNLTETSCGKPLRDISAEYSSMNIASGAFAVLIVVARLAFRRFFSGSGQLGVDDWIILAAIIVAVPATVLNQVGLVDHGIGRDIWTLQSSELPLFAKFFFLMELIYIIQMSLVKLSLSVFYLYVFPGHKMRRLLIGTAAFNVVFGVVFVVAALTQCMPLHYYWAQYFDKPPQGTCFDLNKFAWANAGLGLAVDVWMIILPMSQVRKLKLHWKKKIGVIIMFILGAFVSLISLIRLKSVIFFANLVNPTWDQWNVAWWSTMEVNIGIICTCLPTMRLILKRIFPKLLDTDERGTGASRTAGASVSSKDSKGPGFSMDMSTTTLVAEAPSAHKRLDDCAVSMEEPTTMTDMEEGVHEKEMPSILKRSDGGRVSPKDGPTSPFEAFGGSTPVRETPPPPPAYRRFGDGSVPTSAFAGLEANAMGMRQPFSVSVANRRVVEDNDNNMI
ncbi:CFEM domain-containing protein [Trichoderma novae-zelandiae]